MAGRIYKLDRWEIAGTFGDLGTLIPVAIALVALCGVNLTTLLLTTGLVYIISGLYYRLPMPVQPLKVLAAIAIAAPLSSDLIAAGAITTGLILLLLCATGFIVLLEKIFPQPVIGGIQFAVGLILMRTAMRLILEKDLLPRGPEVHFQIMGVELPAGIILALVCGMIMLLLRKSKYVPSLFIVIALGIGVGFYYSEGLKGASFLPGLDLHFMLPGWKAFADAFLLLVIPQLPVTLGNSVLATKDLSEKLFREKASRATVRALSSGLGFFNVAIGLLNGMPVCHGCGGLSAHYNFGARTGGATIFLGSLLVLLGILFGNAALPLLSLIPWSVLGVMLFSVGIFQSFLIRDLRGWEFLLAFAIGVGGLLATNLSIPFLAGLIIYHTLKFVRRFVGKE